jgi:hypothetical protein
MTTARITKELEEWNKESITPSKSILCIRSFPCEERNAHIREETRKAMNGKDNDPEVALRYLQNKKGQEITSIEAFLAASLFILTLIRSGQDFDSKEIMNPSDYFNMLITLSYCIFTLLPNVNNMINYHHTKNKCVRWLEDKLETEDLNQIKNMTYSGTSITALNTLFIKRGYNTLPEKKLRHISIPSGVLSGIAMLTMGFILPDILPVCALLMSFSILIPIIREASEPIMPFEVQSQNQNRF